MGVLLQASYRRAPGVSVPSPADGDSSIPWWWDHLARRARAFRLAGFTAILLPPVLKTSAGTSPGADGYGTFDDYDLGSKNQFFAIPTRFGSRELLQRCIAVMRANGIDVYADVVLHQRDGGMNGVYEYVAANGAPRGGRFAKHRGCFVGDPSQGFVDRDPLPGPIEDDFAFGDELAPLHGVPKDYVWNGLVDAGDWLTRSLGIQGYRIDDVKGLAVPFVGHWLTTRSMANKFAVGEYYDGNPRSLNWWVWESGMFGRAAAFDFSVHFALRSMCNNTSRWDMRQLDHVGLAGISPGQAVTFVENPDTDTDSATSVIWNKLLGYVYILTSEGYPSVYYKDYATDSGCYGLEPLLDNLIWIHENLAFGTTIQRWKDYQCYVFERQGYPNLLVGMNNDMYSGWRTVHVQTGFGPNVQLHDYTGHAGDVWTDCDGAVTIGIPPNDNGGGYVCYSRTGYGQAFSSPTWSTTQVFEGAADLDIGPALEGGTTVGRIWCAAGTPVEGTLSVDSGGWGEEGSLVLELVDAAGVVLATARCGKGAGATSGSVTARAESVPQSGWITVRLQGVAIPAEGVPFAIAVTYTATKTL